MLLLSLQTLLLGSVLLVLFHLRPRLGLVPLYVFLGSLQLLQTLASAVLVPAGSEMLVPPGSAVLFSATLLAILVVYIREDATETRKLIYALLTANAATCVLLLSLAWQIAQPGAVDMIGVTPGLFIEAAGHLTLGSALLAADAFLLVILYEAFARRLPGLLAPMAATLVLTLCLDSLLYATVTLWDHPRFASVLATAVVSKVAAGLCYALLGTLYLGRFERDAVHVLHGQPVGFNDGFSVLSYRQKYERAEAAAKHDDLTGVYNRNYFNTCFPRSVQAAADTAQPLSVLFVDLDHFKRINDVHGHAVGDRILAAVADTLQHNRRSADWVARYGGEEFVVMLPGADAAAGRRIAEVLRSNVAALDVAHGVEPTVTIGVACLPDDGRDADALLQKADRRMYAGKAGGRNQVVASD